MGDLSSSSWESSEFPRGMDFQALPLGSTHMRPLLHRPHLGAHH